MRPANVPRTITPIVAAALLALAADTGGAGAQSVHRFTFSAGDTIAVYEEGSGPAVVVVPGLLGSAYGFRHVTAALTSAGHRVIIVDPLGTGASARPDRGDYTLEGQAIRVQHVLDSLAVPSALLLCHSIGGSICYRLALRAPDRIVGIVGLNAGPDERAATDGLRSAVRLAPLARVLGSGSMRSRVRDGLIESSADPAWVTDEVVAAYTAPFDDVGRAMTGLRGMAAAREPDPLGPRLREIRVPVVLLVGAVGPVIETDALARLQSELSSLTIVRIDDAGQYIQEERPDAVVRAVRGLQARIARGRTSDR